jgi:hypothetical protein
MGGYTSASWKNSFVEEWHEDEEAFLFSFDMKAKFKIIDPKKAIYRWHNLMSAFGSGCDLFFQPP